MKMWCPLLINHLKFQNNASRALNQAQGPFQCRVMCTCTGGTPVSLAQVSDLALKTISLIFNVSWNFTEPYSHIYKIGITSILLSIQGCGESYITW